MLLPLASFAQQKDSPQYFIGAGYGDPDFVAPLGNFHMRVIELRSDTLEIFNPLKVKVIKIGDEYYEINVELNKVSPKSDGRGIAFGYGAAPLHYSYSVDTLFQPNNKPKIKKKK